MSLPIPIFSPYYQKDDKENILLFYYFENNNYDSEFIYAYINNIQVDSFFIERQSIEPFALYKSTKNEVWYCLTLPKEKYKNKIVSFSTNQENFTTLTIKDSDIDIANNTINVNNITKKMRFSLGADNTQDKINQLVFFINNKEYKNITLNYNKSIATLDVSDFDILNNVQVIYSTEAGYIYKKFFGNISLTDNISTLALNNFELKLTVFPQEELGANQLVIQKDGEESLSASLTIKRKNQETEDIDTIIFPETILTTNTPIIYLDNTIEADVGYSYTVLSGGVESNNVSDIYNFYEDMYLLDNQKTLKIKYNPKISSYKYNYAETVTSTLGSEYPFIRRNGKQKYRNFQIEGLISYNSEFYETSSELSDSVFKTDLILNDDSSMSYDFIDIDFYNTIIKSNLDEIKKQYKLERHFRDAVINYLQDGKIKLFKSAQEGNILVRLTNINLTPNEQLGRNIYSFSATATEIALASMENYAKYNVLKKVLKDYLYLDYYVLSEGFDKDGVLIINSDQIEDGALMVNKEEIPFTLEESIIVETQ